MQTSEEEGAGDGAQACECCRSIGCSLQKAVRLTVHVPPFDIHPGIDALIYVSHEHMHMKALKKPERNLLQSCRINTPAAVKACKWKDVHQRPRPWAPLTDFMLRRIPKGKSTTPADPQALHAAHPAIPHLSASAPPATLMHHKVVMVTLTPHQRFMRGIHGSPPPQAAQATILLILHLCTPSLRRVGKASCLLLHPQLMR